MRSPALLLLALAGAATAQFGFFEHMFGGSDQGGHHHQQRRPNVPSDPSIYQRNYQSAHCDKYLCPDTLACVHFPHHCPCPWPNHQEKFEFGEGSKICVSRGGFKAGEAARKVELARKNLL